MEDKLFALRRRVLAAREKAIEQTSSRKVCGNPLCPLPGRQFARGLRESMSNWVRRRYCSQTCQGLHERQAPGRSPQAGRGGAAAVPQPQVPAAGPADPLAGDGQEQVAPTGVLQPGVRERGAVRVSSVPETREAMRGLGRDGPARAHQAPARHRAAGAADHRRAAGLHAGPTASRRREDRPEAYRERICKAARSFGMIMPGEVK